MLQMLIGTNIPFMRYRRWAYLFSAVLIVSTIVWLVVHGGPYYSVDFTGVGIEGVFQIVDFQYLIGHRKIPLHRRNFGSSASLRPSPKRLKESIVREIMIAGMRSCDG